MSIYCLFVRVRLTDFRRLSIAALTRRGWFWTGNEIHVPFGSFFLIRERKKIHQSMRQLMWLMCLLNQYRVIFPLLHLYQIVSRLSKSFARKRGESNVPRIILTLISVFSCYAISSSSIVPAFLKVLSALAS
jgi:hypothetical protein